MSDIFCGVGDVPKKQRRGTMKQCAEKGQIRYYGIKKVDMDELKSMKKEGAVPETREKLIKQITKEKGAVNRFKGRYENAPKSLDQKTKEDYLKKWKDAEKKLKVLIPKFNKLEEEREKASKESSKKTSKKPSKKSTKTAKKNSK